MYPRLFNLEKIPPSQSFFLFGPRTTGKSTLIHQYLRGKASITYDLLKNDDYLRLHANPSLIRQDLEARIKKETLLQVFVDEVQKIPALLSEVHWLIEKFKGKIRFILTGSSARKLKRGGADLLAGRAWQRTLHPLSFLEMGEDFSLEEALQFGTLPSIVSRDSLSRREELKAYVSTYLREEIQAEALTRSLDSFHRFLDAVALSNGELINMTNIGQEARVKRKTVASYFQILEDTLVGFFLPSWGHQVSRRELVTHGKFYLFDTGVVSALNNTLSDRFEKKHPLFGKAFEHFCILEFIRLHAYMGTEHKFGFFRTRKGSEIDLIQEKSGGRLRAIEIKSTETVSLSQIRGLTQFGKEFPEAQLIVICRAERPFALGDITCLPWRDFFKKEISKKG